MRPAARADDGQRRRRLPHRPLKSGSSSRATATGRACTRARRRRRSGAARRRSATGTTRARCSSPAWRRVPSTTRRASPTRSRCSSATRRSFATRRPRRRPAAPAVPRPNDDALLHENGDWSVHHLSLEGSDTAAQRAQTPLTARLVDAPEDDRPRLPQRAGAPHRGAPHCGAVQLPARACALAATVPETAARSARRGETRASARGRGARPRRRLRARGVERLGRAARHPDRRRVAPRAPPTPRRVDGGDAGGEAPAERRRRRDGDGSRARNS